MDYNLPGSPVHGILQAGILECPALLQGIFLTQGSNPHLLHLLHWQAGSLPLAPPGKPSGWDIDLNYCDTEWFALEATRDHSVIF